MAGWHHQLNGHEFEQTQGDSEGQRSLACCSPLGPKELDRAEPQNNDIEMGEESQENWRHKCSVTKMVEQ